MLSSCFSCTCFHDLQQEYETQIPKDHPLYRDKTLKTIIDGKNFTKVKSKKLSEMPTLDTSKAQIVLQNQTIYQGQIKGGKASDKNGILIFPDGSYYRGQVKCGLINGYGAYVFADQSYSYMGPWKNGLPHGQGLEVSPCGTYQGKFVKGKKWGHGKLKFEDGSIFIGSFQNNLINGQGTFQSAGSKSIAKGNWINGFLQGAGRQQYPDGSQYIGYFKKGKPHGSGTFTLANKNVYVGQFLNGKPCGKGVFYKNNKQYPAQWNSEDMISISMSLNSVMNDMSIGGISESDKLSSIISRIGKNRANQNRELQN